MALSGSRVSNVSVAEATTAAAAAAAAGAGAGAGAAMGGAAFDKRGYSLGRGDERGKAKEKTRR